MVHICDDGKDHYTYIQSMSGLILNDDSSSSTQHVADRSSNEYIYQTRRLTITTVKYNIIKLSIA